MNNEMLKDQLRRTYQIYVDGFKENKISLIDSIIKYPIAYLKDGTIEMRDSYPIDPKELKAEKGWHHSTDWSFDIPAINEQHAHAVASAVRRREDGSVIERVHGFYAFAKFNGDWKMYAFSEVVT